jgi:hypothetical protein
MSDKDKNDLVQRIPRMRSGRFLHVTSAGRLEVDGRKLFQTEHMLKAVEALHRIPLAPAEPK